MPIQPGDLLPSLQVRIATPEGPEVTDLQQLLKGKRSVLFTVPGAFTPTCSLKHLPGYQQHLEDFRQKGIDQVICMSVNDAFVMAAWAQHAKIDGIIMLSDGNAEVTRKLGIELDGRSNGLGMRCRRLAMVVNDGRIEFLYTEEPGQFLVSSAEHLLSQL